MSSKQRQKARDGNGMYQTIRLSSCVSVQGECVEVLNDGQVVIRVGKTEYRGRPIERRAPPTIRVADMAPADPAPQPQTL
jgi:hypothetical protein